MDDAYRTIFNGARGTKEIVELVSQVYDYYSSTKALKKTSFCRKSDNRLTRLVFFAVKAS